MIMVFSGLEEVFTRCLRCCLKRFSGLKVAGPSSACPPFQIGSFEQVPLHLPAQLCSMFSKLM